MDELPLSARDTVLLLSVFVGPFLVLGAVAQLAFLRRARVTGLRLATILGSAAFLTLVAALVLVQVVHVTWSNMEGDVLAVPALLAAVIVTAAVALVFGRRRPAA